MVEVIAIIKEVKAKALVSLDKSYRLIVDTEDSAILECGKWPADETVTISIERNNGTEKSREAQED